MTQINGVVPIIPAPFKDDGSVDFDTQDRLVDFGIATNASAVCLPAFATEFYKLSDAERSQMVDRAVKHAAGRVPVVGVANHPAAVEAARIAKEREDQGADMVCTLAPRTFSLSEDDLFRYFDEVCGAISAPFLIQEFNPGGATVGGEFCRKLNSAQPNFQYIKLEEPMAGKKVETIIEATGGKVGVLEGWGGLYMMELIPSGICGIMPSLSMTDLLDQAFRFRQAGQADEAFDIFRELCPYIVFSLQHIELLHHLEKLFMKKRGIMPNTLVRESTIVPDPETLEYAEFLMDRILRCVQDHGLKVNPVE